MLPKRVIIPLFGNILLMVADSILTMSVHLEKIHLCSTSRELVKICQGRNGSVPEDMTHS